MIHELHKLLEGLNALLRGYISLKILKSPLQRCNGDVVPTYDVRYDLVSGVYSLGQWWDI